MQGLAVSGDGSWIAASAHLEAEGRVHLFHRGADGIWTHHSILSAPPPVVSVHFGISIDISEDGTRLKVGAVMRGTIADPYGEIHFFERDGMSWHHSDTVPSLFADH